MIDPALLSPAARATVSRPPTSAPAPPAAPLPRDRVELGKSLRQDLPDLVIAGMSPSNTFPFPGEPVTVDVTQPYPPIPPVPPRR